jgi:very-short-patch-repair endonuclease
MQRRPILPYSHHLKEYARKLRNHATRSEIFMWKQLKGKQLKGYDFHRQKPIGNFIADLYCPELMLAIELDGITHESEAVRQKDQFKQASLQELGVTVLHFTDEEVFFDTDRVFKVLEDFIAAYELLHPKNKPKS